MEIRQKNSLPWSHHVARGNMYQTHIHHQFGRNTACGVSYVPVADTGIYQTPQVAGATQLRVKAGGNAADTAAGAGARSIELHGINAAGDEVIEVINTAGASASAPTSSSFVRLYYAAVKSSGTYGTASSGSHVGSITIENAAGGTEWAQIQLDGFPSGASCIGSLTVPRNHVGLVNSIEISVDTSGGKTMDLLLIQRSNILEASAPYSPIVKIQEFMGLDGISSIKFDVPFKMSELTDVGVMARSSNGTNGISVNMEVLMLEAES